MLDLARQYVQWHGVHGGNNAGPIKQTWDAYNELGTLIICKVSVYHVLVRCMRIPNVQCRMKSCRSACQVLLSRLAVTV